MLENYFLKPSTIDRLRGSWIAAEIEMYVAWMVGRGWATARRVFGGGCRSGSRSGSSRGSVGRG